NRPAFLFHFPFLNIYQQPLKHPIFISLPFLYLIIITTLLTFTTTPIQLTHAVRNLLHPFPKINLPLHQLPLIISISLPFIPTLLQQTHKIIKPQIPTGLHFTTP
ncbi:CbiQ family ECF transporter T component, partial [Bacillus altitudinis]|uniref:CbiQ family ECF transporter T component n=1 Tax=Bacillus altitudinis TaxID=293387 RepID=UPI002354D331